MTDQALASYLLVKCAVEHHYTKIGYIDEDGFIKDKIEASLKQFNIPIQPKWVISENISQPHDQLAVGIAKKLEQLDEKPKVFIAFSDRVAAIIKMNYTDYQHPIIFMGPGNTEYAKIANITTTDSRRKDSVKLVLSLLKDAIESNVENHETYTIPCDIIVRDI